MAVCMPNRVGSIWRVKLLKLLSTTLQQRAELAIAARGLRKRRRNLVHAILVVRAYI